MPHQQMPASYPGDTCTMITSTDEFVFADSAYESDSGSQGSNKHTRGATRARFCPDKTTWTGCLWRLLTCIVSVLFSLFWLLLCKNQLAPQSWNSSRPQIVLNRETSRRILTPVFLLLAASQAGQGEFLTGRVTVCEDFGVDLARILNEYNQKPIPLDTTHHLCVQIDAVLRTLGRSKNKIAYTLATAILVKSTCSLLHLDQCWDVAGLLSSIVAILLAAAADYSAMDEATAAELVDMHPTTYKDIMAHALRDRGLGYSSILPVAVPCTGNGGGSGVLSADDKLEDFVIQDFVASGTTAAVQDIHVTWYRNSRTVVRLLPLGQQDTRTTSGEAQAFRFFDGVGYLVSFGTGYLAELSMEEEDEMVGGIVRAWEEGMFMDERMVLGVSSIEKGVEYVSLYVDVDVAAEDEAVEIKGSLDGFL
ncbi:uncharacterized protein BO72DRAFT_495226 [Aspergillus fijiensis CBS 313.89]|uniref:Uncharacterized protein n=1 Tax=Aspergillus fijiensis CBS 313.89 TaxID=1448319 RepID=A0A8G1RVV6_9EURO|nr:uncharacterized protein BO72DRAFT_495226 [Aspergillus fijiensis CBS 313.89]RAK78491.1 hypothetical protein BO72DRAFT_495226 [Aspergillus fijiensis CBS 313.89]